VLALQVPADWQIEMSAAMATMNKTVRILELMSSWKQIAKIDNKYNTLQGDENLPINHKINDNHQVIRQVIRHGLLAQLYFYRI
jgi:hypothetical protein